MLDGLDREVDVQVRPIQMMRARQLDVRDCPDRCVTKPRELFKRDEQLALAHEQPKSVNRDIRDFNRGSRTHATRIAHLLMNRVNPENPVEPVEPC